MTAPPATATQRLRTAFTDFGARHPAPPGQRWTVQATRCGRRRLYFLALVDDAGAVTPLEPAGHSYYLGEMAAYLEGMLAARKLPGRRSGKR